MSEGEQLTDILAVAGDGFVEGLRRTEQRLEIVAASGGERLGSHAGGTLAAGGKRLRPMLVFLCAGRADPDDGIVAAAAAVELLHMATLVHDDVLDQASLRRGEPTVFAAAGREAATATGDFLFSRAFAQLAATGSAAAVQALSDASSALAQGELMQRADAWSQEVAIERYLARCELKTGSLFAASCRLGAVLAGRSPSEQEALGEYGRLIGLAFQILDDVLDISGPAERTGKHRGTDLLDGTVTLPLILARQRQPAIARVDLRSIATPQEAEAMCDHIVASGALDEARGQALGYVGQAKDGLTSLDLEPWQRRALGLVAEGVVKRYA